MRSTWFTPVARVATALVVAVAVAGSTAAARPKPGVKHSSNLFALTAAIMQVNNQYCPVINTGNVCTDPSGNGVIEGGFWPKGTPDSYIFNSGLQIGGNIPVIPGFAWSGDTVGAFFMDPRGDQADGAPITLVYNSLDAGDQAAWPSPDGVVRDAAVYNPVLLGRTSVSQQDLWFRAWDGNPNKLGGRTHPMGILVDVRGMAWNYPSGNQDVMYFVYTFTNVTDSVTADYDNPSVTNRDLNYRQNLAAIGAQFQQLNGTKYGISFPPNGYELDNVFSAFFEDCDVGSAANIGLNYSTPVFPFAMGVCYEAPFNEPTWLSAGGFPSTIFSGAFSANPGFTSVKYLKSPIFTSGPDSGQQIGITMFSNTVNGGTGYPDPVGIKQMYRYISGTSDPALGDLPCTDQTNHVKLHYCVLWQTAVDTRFFQSSGPLTLLPAHSATIVVAYINAPPVAAALAGKIGGDFKPGFAATGDSIYKDPTAVRPIERVMGWQSQSDQNNDQIIEQGEVKSVRGSLLNKALVAQAVFDGKFLLPFSPEAPQFFLIPGDNQVTVVWQKSRTEDPTVGGDPYYAIASDPTNALYDPDFRHFDVEGYRIYRGRTPGNLALVAQFDYAGTQMIDYSGQFNYGNCAPELGVNKTTPGNTCPIKFDSLVTPASPGNAIELVATNGPLVQVPPGGRVKLADGTILVTSADTAVTGGGSVFPPLSNTGVTFAYVDRGVRNLFQYFYSVSAFDINSIVSGPSSLESALVTKSVTPRAAGSFSSQAGGLSALQLIGANNVQLNTNAATPSIDATSGEFSGPMPPTNGIGLGFVVFIPELVDSGAMSLSIDSIVPDTSAANVISDAPSCGNLAIAKYYVTASGNHLVVPVGQDVCVGDNTASVQFPGANVKQAKGSIFGGDSTFSMLGQVSFSTAGAWRTTSPGRGNANGSPSNSLNTGPRWWAGAANENTSDPNSLNTVCGGTCSAALVTTAPSAGAISGVNILNIQAYNTVANAPMRDAEAFTGIFYRSADFALYWGTAGTIDSVVDLTHHLQVPFNKSVRASWGVLDSSSFAGVTTDHDGNNNLLTWTDLFCVDPVPAVVNVSGGCAVNRAKLTNTAHLTPMVLSGATFASLAAPPAATGNGFILYLAGKWFMMQMAALPAAGTVWNARFPAGNIVGTQGSYSYVEADERPTAVPGLKAAISYKGSSPVDLKNTTGAQLAAVHTVPDPYYVTNALEITPSNKVLKFVNLPGQCIVRIYSVSGILVQVLTHNDATGGGELDWDLRNRSNQFVASGVYFYHVEAADGQTKVGRFTVVQFAP